MNPMQMARFAADALRGRASDPSWNTQGQPLPRQAVLDQPIPMPQQQSVMPVQMPGIVDASGLGDKVGGVAAALAERERQRRQLLEQMNQ